jgi:F0F1-type ATP synthase membrane subunit c/vacuolar-type H+-ATPase subunit K
MLVALSEAWTASIALIVVFGIVFPALATGLIAFAIAQAMAERRENLERKQGRGRT